jgi:hypothetical protein
VDQDEIIRRFFLEGNPNPERQGCPGPDVLRAIAEDTLPANDPARLHLSACSPCFRQYYEFRRERAKRIKRCSFALLASAGIVVSGIGIGMYRRPPHEPNVRYGQPASRSALRAVAFVSYDANSALSGDRGTDQPRVMQPIELVRTLSLHLSITLPVGMDGGTYETQLRYGSDSAPVYSSTGNAVMNPTSRNNVLSIILPTDQLPSGRYRFYFRRTGAVQWWPVAADLR